MGLALRGRFFHFLSLFMPQLQRRKKRLRPRQKQPRQPGLEEKMHPRPEAWIKTTGTCPSWQDRALPFV